MVRRVRQEGRSVAETADELGVSRQTVYKWLRRFAGAGVDGLEDRPSRPLRAPRETPVRTVQRIERLRRRRLTAVEIAAQLGLAASTVSRILRRIGLGKLWRVEAAQPPRRYEHPQPGALVHIDAKKFARIERVGHRIHGDRSQRHYGAGWEWTFVAVDDCTRLAYAEVAAKEDGACATRVLGRVLARFQNLGIRVERILTDNAKCYVSSSFRELCTAQHIRQVFTRPYTPRTNGKAERFIQTLTRRWAYRRSYPTSAHRTAALRPWIAQYNHSRPHRALGMRPPMARLRESREQRP
jgi:transposase InsO family protein